MIIKQSQLDFVKLFQNNNNHSNNSHCIPVYALIDIYDVGYMDLFYCCFITLIFF
jgi:hypothetical protein